MMGKIKNALISWNQENGYNPDQVSGWGRKKTDGPTMKDLVKQKEKDDYLIKGVVMQNEASKNIEQEFQDFEITKFINDLNSLDDIKKYQDMLSNRRDTLARKTKYNLVIGEEVTISGSGRIEKGKIVKINRTRAVVDCFDKMRDKMIHYTVPFSMIRKINNEE